MSRRSFIKGDWVVFRKRKYTTHPGCRAKDVQAAKKGDYYSYSVDKFWVVVEVLPDGQLLLQTRRGKQHVIDPEDPNLRHANLWDRIRYRERFGQLQTPDQNVRSDQLLPNEG